LNCEGTLTGGRDISDTTRPSTGEGALTGGRDISSTASAANSQYPHVLVATVAEHTYRGVSLAAWVDGAGTVFPQGVLMIHPEDARHADIDQGDEVKVSSATFARTWPVSIHDALPRGTLHITLRPGDCPAINPVPVRLEKP
jgi:anaerobic selenocysteine-containing dehydrogenase